MAKIQMRRDTAANWTSANPTLSAGEIGVELDTNKLKVGNGTNNWTSLPYLSGTGPSGPAGPPGNDGISVVVLSGPGGDLPTPLPPVGTLIFEPI